MLTTTDTAGWPTQNIDQILTSPFPLSMAQQGVWFDQIHHADIPIYNIGLSLLLDGPFDISLLKEAINIVVNQNDAMRLVMHCVDGVPSQRILPEIDVSLPLIDFSGGHHDNSAALAYIKKEFQKSFQLEGNTLFSFQIIRISSSRSYWLHRYHHLITDNVGIQFIYSAIASKYNQLLSGKREIDSPVPSYKYLIEEEAGYLASERFSRDQKFWQEKFSALPPPLF